MTTLLNQSYADKVKYSFFKEYFLFFSLVVTLIAVSTLKKKNHEIKMLKVAFPYSKSAKDYDPAKIYLAPEYIFLETIYSPLVELSNTGEVIPGVAKDFFWSGNELHLVIRDDLFTGSGKRIVAEDVEFSLKRLFVISKNTHGDLVDLICPDSEITSIDQKCDGIKVDGNEVILKVERKTPFLVPMLASIDFAVIPTSSVDRDTLEIKDYSETSGPYFVSRDSSSGRIMLKANSNHYHFSSKIADEILLVPTSDEVGNSSIDKFKKGEVDVLTTIDHAEPYEVLKELSTLENIQIHRTLNIRTYTIGFTKKGRDFFSQSERVSIGVALKEALAPFFIEKPGFELTDQFFPPFGEGGLDAEQVTALREYYDKIDKIKSGKNISLGTIRVGDASRYSKLLREKLPEIEVFEIDQSESFLEKTNDSVPMIEFSGPDTGFLEDISLVSYSIAADYMWFKDEKSEKYWMNRYMNSEDKSDRLKMLKNLHFDTLLSGITIPVATAPYLAVTKKPIKLNLSKFYANCPLWRIEIN